MSSLERTKTPRIELPVEQIRQFCRRNHIRFLALFGSVLREDFNQESDIDVLVKFEPDHVPGFRFFAMQQELSEILGREVDLNTADFLSPHIRSRANKEAVVIYAETG